MNSIANNVRTVKINKRIELQGKRGILFILILFVLFFAKPSTTYSLGWDTLTPKETDETYFWHLDGFITYTYSDRLNYTEWRHSYFWMHLTGGYELLPNFWISTWLNIEKFSFSENLNIFATEDFVTNFLPQVTYSNFHELSGKSNDQLLLQANLGTIGDFTHAKGLLYSQFTGMGTHALISYNDLSLDFYQMGYGYFIGDDVSSLIIYPFKKFVGVGSLLELNGVMGDRIVPDINFEVNTLKTLRFFGEMSLAYIYKPNILYNSENFHRQFQYYLYQGDETNATKVDYYSPYFSPKFSINSGTIAGLLGIEWKFHFPHVWNLEGTLVNEARYYGKEYVDYYIFQSYNVYSNYNNGWYSYYNFGHYQTISNDQKYNNQPSNFYMYQGDKIGFYLRQEFEINPINNFFIKARNEFLWVFASITNDGKTVTKTYGNDTVRISIIYRLKDHVDFGVQVSNVLIGDSTEYKDPNLNPSFRQDGFYLQASTPWMIDFYSHFYF